MASMVDAAGEPVPTSSVLMAAAKHIEINCMPENVEFIKCKKKDPNPEKCLEKGRQATRCALGLLKDLYQRCKDPMEGYVGCMYYHTNEFDLCRKQQQAFEKACPLDEKKLEKQLLGLGFVSVMDVSAWGTFLGEVLGAIFMAENHHNLKPGTEEMTINVIAEGIGENSEKC